MLPASAKTSPRAPQRAQTTGSPVLAGVVASTFLVLSGACLFNSRGKGRPIAIGLMIAAAITAALMAVLALTGALRGQSREGLREAYLAVGFFPAAVVLLALTASGAWYLTRSRMRR